MNYLRNTSEITEPNYPFNAWWVAATSEEVGDKPVVRRLLGQPVVLYRIRDGTPVALKDRCIHRWAPISTGYVEGDEIVCGYHGARFGKDGRCNQMPSQDSVPPGAAVTSYPVVEKFPYIWIWMGDPMLATNAPEPHAFDWITDPANVVAKGFTPLDANYFLLQENVLDLTHFNYAHRNSLGGSDILVPKYERKGDEVWFELIQDPVELNNIELLWLKPDHEYRREIRDVMATPGVHIGYVQMIDKDAAPGDRNIYRVWVTHCVTPAAPDKTYYWWALARDYGRVEGAEEALAQGLIAAFDEDKYILESIQANLAGEQALEEITFKGDMGGLMARRVLAKLLNAERNENVTQLRAKATA